MKKIFTAILLASVLAVVMAGVASAQAVATPESTIPTGITTAQGFIDLMRTLTDWLFVILVVISVIFIVLAGLQFITGGGDPAAVSMARTKLIWAAVGIGVALLARGLPAAIQNLLGAG
ncbi:MAG TPA: hypothetical protein VJC15_03005 [Candidatus Paceibacterota bacterium]